MKYLVIPSLISLLSSSTLFAAPINPMENYTPTDISDKYLTVDRIWENLDANMKGKDCYKRAHIWSYDTDTLMPDNFREFWPGASEAIYGNGWRRSCGNGDAQNRSTAAGGRQMDIQELAAGSVLYLPVEVDGALFSLADAHAAQGDGMVGARNAVCEMIDLLTARHSLSPE